MIRRAEERDLPQLAGLYQQLYTILCDEYGYPFTFHAEENQEMLKIQIKSKFCCIFVAEENGRLLGFVHGSISKLDRRLSYKGSKAIARIDDIFTVEEARGSGIAAALLDAAEQWFAEGEIPVVESYIVTENLQSLKFHEKHGYEQAAVRLLKDLS